MICPRSMNQSAEQLLNCIRARVAECRGERPRGRMWACLGPARKTGQDPDADLLTRTHSGAPMHAHRHSQLCAHNMKGHPCTRTHAHMHMHTHTHTHTCMPKHAHPHVWPCAHNTQSYIPWHTCPHADTKHRPTLACTQVRAHIPCTHKDKYQARHDLPLLVSLLSVTDKQRTHTHLGLGASGERQT